MLASAIAAAFGFAADSRAQLQWTWKSPPATSIWNDPNNWNGPGGIPNSPTGVANVNVFESLPQNILINSSISLGTLNLGFANTSYSILPSLPNVAFNLTPQGTSNTSINITPGAAATMLTIPINIGTGGTGSLVISQNSTVAPLTIATNVTDSRSLIVQGSGNTNFGGALLGNGQFIKADSGTCTFTSSSQINLTGQMSVLGGRLSLASAPVPSGPSILLVGGQIELNGITNLRAVQFGNSTTLMGTGALADMSGQMLIQQANTSVSLLGGANTTDLFQIGTISTAGPATFHTGDATHLGRVRLRQGIVSTGVTWSVDGGSLVATNPSALGIAPSVLVNSSSTLEIENTSISAMNLTLRNGGTLMGTGALSVCNGTIGLLDQNSTVTLVPGVSSTDVFSLGQLYLGPNVSTAHFFVGQTGRIGSVSLSQSIPNLTGNFQWEGTNCTISVSNSLALGSAPSVTLDAGGKLEMVTVNLTSINLTMHSGSTLMGTGPLSSCTGLIGLVDPNTSVTLAPGVGSTDTLVVAPIYSAPNVTTPHLHVGTAGRVGRVVLASPSPNLTFPNWDLDYGTLSVSDPLGLGVNPTLNVQNVTTLELVNVAIPSGNFIMHSGGTLMASGGLSTIGGTVILFDQPNVSFTLSGGHNSTGMLVVNSLALQPASVQNITLTLNAPGDNGTVYLPNAWNATVPITANLTGGTLRISDPHALGLVNSSVLIRPGATFDINSIVVSTLNVSMSSGGTLMGTGPLSACSGLITLVDSSSAVTLAGGTASTDRFTIGPITAGGGVSLANMTVGLPGRPGGVRLADPSTINTTIWNVTSNSSLIIANPSALALINHSVTINPGATLFIENTTIGGGSIFMVGGGTLSCSGQGVCQDSLGFADTPSPQVYFTCDTVVPGNLTILSLQPTLPSTQNVLVVVGQPGSNGNVFFPNAWNVTVPVAANITSGSLSLGNPNALGLINSTVTVNPGATLGIINSTISSMNVVLRNNSTITTSGPLTGINGTITIVDPNSSMHLVGGGVLHDITTLPPILTTPNATTITPNLHIEYTLGEARATSPSPTVTLRWIVDSGTLTFTDPSAPGTINSTVEVNPNATLRIEGIGLHQPVSVHDGGIIDTNYTVSLSYQDLLTAPDASSSITLVCPTLVPQLSTPNAPGTSPPTTHVHIEYTLPGEAQASNPSPNATVDWVIDSGALKFTNSAAAGTLNSTIHVNPNTTLDISGITLPQNISIHSGGTIMGSSGLSVCNGAILFFNEPNLSVTLSGGLNPSDFLVFNDMEPLSGSVIRASLKLQNNVWLPNAWNTSVPIDCNITSGRLRVGDPNSLGLGNSTVLVNPGARFEIFNTTISGNFNISIRSGGTLMGSGPLAVCNGIVGFVDPNSSVTLAAGPNPTDRLTLSYLLPEAPLSNSVTLLFNEPGGNGTVALTNSMNTTLPVQANIVAGRLTLFDPHSLGFGNTTVHVNTGSTLELMDGNYTISLQYQDLVNVEASGNATSVGGSILYDTATLTPRLHLIGPPSSGGTFTINYALPEAPPSGALYLTFGDVGRYGRIRLTHDSNTVAAQCDVTSGSLVLASPLALGINSSVIIKPNVALELENVTVHFANLSISSGGTLMGTGALSTCDGIVSCLDVNTTASLIGGINPTDRFNVGPFLFNPAGDVNITIGAAGQPGQLRLPYDCNRTSVLWNVSSTLVAASPHALGLINSSVTVNPGARFLIENTTIDLGNLVVKDGGQAAWTAGGGGSLYLRAGIAINTTVGSTARLDLADHKLIIPNGVVGTVNDGTAYGGVTGMIQSGRHGGDWLGPGIVTSQTAATSSNFTSIGVAQASDVRPATATVTALWSGQTITGTDTLVMYTYGGDATLDGKINIDDYIRIDAGFAGHLTGWSNGDFNYDGKVNIDDYTTVIDANFPNQNGFVFPTGGGINGDGAVSGVSAVPEPAGISLVVGATALLMRRRRRRARSLMRPAIGAASACPDPSASRPGWP